MAPQDVAALGLTRRTRRCLLSGTRRLLRRRHLALPALLRRARALLDELLRLARLPATLGQRGRVLFVGLARLRAEGRVRVRVEGRVRVSFRASASAFGAWPRLAWCQMGVR